MLLLPLLREGGGSRRTPWATLALVALNVATLIGVSLYTDDGAVSQELGRLVGFLRDHPYLDPSRDLAAYLDEDFRAELALRRQDVLSRAGPPPLEAFAREQSELGERERLLRAQMQSLPTQRLGFVPARPWSPAILTSLFVHAGWLHLVGNLLFLWVTAPFLEDRLGRVAFLGLYLASGVAACAAHALRFSSSDTPLVGASGAIAGLMGAFVVYFLRTRIRFLVIPTPVTVSLPAFLVFPFWFGEQVWFARRSGEAGVAFYAHIGGFVVGLALAGLLKAMRDDESTRPPDEADRLAYQAALQDQDRDAIGEIGSRLLDRLERAGDHGAALELVAETRLRVAAPVPSRLWLAFAALLERHHVAEALAVYQELIDSDGSSPMALRALMRRAALLRREGDVAGSCRAYEQARLHPAGTETSRQAVDRALGPLGPR